MTEKDTNINEVEESVDTDRSPRSAQSRDKVNLATNHGHPPLH